MRWSSRGPIIALLVALAGCSGGGSTSTPSAIATPTPVVPPLTNFATLIVDSGPTAAVGGVRTYVGDDIPYVTLTICAPDTTTCQTIDHVVVDTGSVGLRILASVLNPSMIAALPQQKDDSANPVAECLAFVDGYAFGSVRFVDFKIGGEAVANMPMQIIGDGDRFAAVPASCSAGGGTRLAAVKDIGGNGILGIGVTTTDCGTRCTVTGGSSAAAYYDCPPTGCVGIIARAATTIAPFQQLPNPVAAMAVDNNGSIISLPAVPDSGARTLTGTLYFGIGTQTNNALGAATVVTTSSSAAGSAGLFTVVYKAASLTNSFIDSGSNSYFFTDSAITACADTNLKGYYCPPTPLSLALVIQGRNGTNATVALPLFDAKPLLLGANAAVPGIGADPSATASLKPVPRSFDLGLPFFFGRNVYIGIEGRAAGTATGPFFAF